VYAAENPQYDEGSGEDPLAHYCRTGRPDGRWRHKIISPSAESRAAVSLRVGIHGHFHYPDLLADFLERLRCNATVADLLLTTTSDDRALAISDILSKFDVHNATVSVVPNRGRNIGALLSAYAPRVLDGFDVLGHFHGKLSPQFDSSVGNTWRDVLWESLLGGEHAMMDVVMRAFAADPMLGLVFAEDPHLNDWDDNRVLAEEFASRMGLRTPLPNHFDFPIGAMFWIRPQALWPLLNLRLSWDDYPPEPAPIDGTSLHTLERLIPFSSSHAGYQYAATYLKGRTR
jgi:lipopolysaccharide biosynthesis protein